MYDFFYVMPKSGLHHVLCAPDGSTLIVLQSAVSSRTNMENSLNAIHRRIDYLGLP